MKSNRPHELSKIVKQHLKYTALLEDLRISIVKNNKDTSIKIFSELTDYTRLHQEYEESLMKKINYPYSDLHIIEHNRLRNIFNSIFLNLHQIDTHKIVPNLLEIKNDSISHILYRDMQLVEYYKSKYKEEIF